MPPITLTHHDDGAWVLAIGDASPVEVAPDDWNAEEALDVAQTHLGDTPVAWTTLPDGGFTAVRNEPSEAVEAFRAELARSIRDAELRELGLPPEAADWLDAIANHVANFPLEG